MIRTSLRQIAAAVALAAIAGSVQAALLHNGTGLASPQQVVDFESVPLTGNQPVTQQFAALGLVFESAYANADMGSPFENISGNRIGNFQWGIPALETFAIHFAAPLSAAAWATGTSNGATSYFEAYLHGQLVESATAPTSLSDPVNFYGFTGIVFDELRMRANGPIDRAFTIDNLQTVTAATVPEPTSFSLLLACLGALRLAGRPRGRR
ncbi:hypothetical protein ACS5PN_06055 [Roseateles sp. NT4]|uniref:hypothetical protein n=1 Tax=Roseateles sp. NT4 TaxID=3453715 RepID=UPI003EEA1BFE